MQYDEAMAILLVMSINKYKRREESSRRKANANNV